MSSWKMVRRVEGPMVEYKALRQATARILREGSCDSVPVKEGIFQRQSRFNAVLDLMEGETEFTPAAQRSADWME